MAAVQAVDLSEFDELAALNVKQPQCSVHHALQAMTDDQAEKFRAAMASKKYTYMLLSEWCKAQGFEVEDHTISRHIRGKCRCER